MSRAPDRLLRAAWLLPIREGVGHRLLLTLLLATSPTIAGAQATFLPGGDDSYFQSSSGVDVRFTGEPGCTVEDCNVFDADGSEADLFALTPAEPATLDDSVTDVSIPDIATGSASSSGTVTIALDGDQLSGGTIDLVAFMRGVISHSYLEDEFLLLQALATAQVAFSFETTAPALIRLAGSIGQTNSDPALFYGNTFVQFRRTPGTAYATFDEAGGFDTGWIPLVVGVEALILANVDLQLMASHEDCACVGALISTGADVHVEFEIIPAPEPGTAGLGLAAALALAALTLRRAPRWRLANVASSSGRPLLLALLLTALPGVAGAQAIFLPDLDSQFQVWAKIEVPFYNYNDPGCSVDPAACTESDVDTATGDLHTLGSGPISLAVSVADVGYPGVAIGSASTSGTLSLELDGDRLSGGTVDLSTSISQQVIRPYHETEELSLTGSVWAPVQIVFETTVPAAIHIFGTLSETNPDPVAFNQATRVQFRPTPGFVLASLDTVGAFDFSWIPLSVGDQSMILIRLDTGLNADRYCDCVGPFLVFGTDLHLEFEIVPVPEPSTAGAAIASLAPLVGIARARRRAQAS